MYGVATHAELLVSRSPKAIRHATESGDLRRLRHGVYVDADPSLAARVRAVQVTIPRAVASHATAAALLGFGEVRGPVHVTVPHALGVRSATDVVVHRDRRHIPVQLVRGLLLTTSVRTVLDVARSSPPGAGIVAADAALTAGLCTRDDLIAGLDVCRGLRGVALARRAVALCRIGAESPMETRLRLLLVDAGLPEPTLQHPVVTGLGQLRLDLSWPAPQIAVEYDGFEPHTTPQAFARDRARWRALAAGGWDVHPVTYADLRQPHHLIAEVRAALAARCTSRGDIRALGHHIAHG